jgi:predicted RNA binding protein YcfA (HicA-like mRNA interferase family)
MTRLPRITGRQLIRTPGQIGFEVLRVRGSQTFLKHPDGRTTVVPVHSGEIIGPGLLRTILREIEISVDELGGHL